MFSFLFGLFVLFYFVLFVCFLLVFSEVMVFEAVLFVFCVRLDF